MALRPIWIVNGKPQAEALQASPVHEWDMMNRSGAVRLLSGPEGTELRWIVAAPNVMSLFAADAMLDYLDGPFMLRFFSAGWFEERFSTAEQVRSRISALVMHGDRHLASRVFVDAPDPKSVRIPEFLKEVLEERAAPREQAVECRYEPEVDGFVVSHIGARSAIGRIWGTDPSSFPCLATGAFGQSASLSYSRAVRERVPVYEQVIAALRFPDQTVHWVPYHRVILPVEGRRNSETVDVVCEYADVDFRVL
jgi:hypothetical protein